MAFQPIPNTLSVTFDQQFGVVNVRYQNRMYFENALGWSSAGATNVATAAGNAWRDNVMPLINTDGNFFRVRFKDEGAEFGVAGEIAYNQQGAVIGDAASLALALGLVFRATAGPPRQGRLFLAGFSESDLAEQLWGPLLPPAGRDAVQAVATAAEAALLDTEHVIVSRHSKSLNPTPPHLRPEGVTAVVDSYQFNSAFWTQRDRRPGEGS